jgi:uncharacterized protein
MRVVLDTNVLVSAALKQKSMPGTAALAVERRGGLLNRSRPKNSLRSRCPAVPYLSDRPRGAGLVEEADGRGRARYNHRADYGVPRSDRRQILELAVNGRADLIVSGDGDLLALNPFRNIAIVTPAAFVLGVVR